MPFARNIDQIRVRNTAVRTMAALTATLMMGGCAGGLGDSVKQQLLAEAPTGAAKAATEPAVQQSELERATEYWGKQYQKNPRDLDGAISYAKNLKAMGSKTQALAVLQQAAIYHGGDRKLTSEYGRLALELDQLSVAGPLLEKADDPSNPDWRVISARGTLLAKQGRYKDATPFYEKAMTLASDRASVANNLAMAYAMSGEAGKAEGLLRKAIETDDTNPKVRQNLAIVLALQGRSDEAKTLGSGALAAEQVAHNAEILKKLVNSDAAQPVAATAVLAGGSEARPAAQKAKAPAAPLKPTNVETAAAARVNAAARLADGAAAGEPVFKPSTR